MPSGRSAGGARTCAWCSSATVPLGKRLRLQNPDFHFAGMRSGEDLAAHYASADMFVFPSLSETFGNVTMEALASGLAVVAFDYAAAREHIVHGHNGLVAQRDDESAFPQSHAASCEFLVRSAEHAPAGQANRRRPELGQGV